MFGNGSVFDTRTLTLTRVNNPPVIDNPLADVSSPEDTAIVLAIPADAFADADLEPLILTAGLVGGASLPAWLSFDGTQFTGTPPVDFNGAIDIEVIASDGIASVAQVFTLTVDPVNDAPVALDDGPIIVTGDGLTIAGSTLLANDSDVDDDSLSIVSVGTASAGTVSLELDGSIVVSGLTGISDVVSFEYTISDGTLQASANVIVHAAGNRSVC